jgi:hypothetical protein
MRRDKDLETLREVTAAMVKMAEINQQTTAQLIQFMRENNRVGEPIAVATTRYQLESEKERVNAQLRQRIMDNQQALKGGFDPMG